MGRFTVSGIAGRHSAAHRASKLMVYGLLIAGLLGLAAWFQRIAPGTNAATPPSSVTALEDAPAGQSTYTSTSADPGQKRVHTAGYLLGYHSAKPTGAQLDQAAQLFDIIETDNFHIGAFKQANPNGKVMIYEDPHRIIHPDHLSTYLSESNYAHCNGERLEGAYASRRMNHVDVRDASSSERVAQELAFRNASISNPGYRWDYWFADDTVRPTGFQCLPDDYDDAKWAAADANYLENAAARANIPVIYNGASRDSGGVLFSDYLSGKKHVAGGMAEACFSHLPAGNPDGPYIDDVGSKYPLWTNVQRAVLRLQHYKPKQIFLCYSNDSESARNASNNFASDIRTYVLASFLMFYDAKTSYLWESFGTNSTVTVEPETGLIPLDPLRRTPVSTNASDIAAFHCGDAYCREYNHCYYNGALVGYCAVEINATHGPDVTAVFPSRRRYTRAMTLTGSGMVTEPGALGADGGKVSFTGTPPASLCSPGTTLHSSITGCVTSAIVFGPTPVVGQREPRKPKHPKTKAKQRKRKST